ncbi:MAG: choice-of-anchor B family protein [Saprospiraceae bacterium]
MNKQAQLCFSLLLIFNLLLVTLGFGQSKNMTLQSNWNQAIYAYNDIWGYADFSGKEYAIIGSKTKIHFIEVTNPTNPTLIAEFALGSNTSWRDIKTFGHYAYAVSEGFTNEGLAIFDLCDIANGQVTKISQINNVFGKAHNIFIDAKDKRLYAVGSNTQSNGVIVYDLSDPANPVLLTTQTLAGGYIHDIFVQDNLAFCSHGYNGLYIYDFSNPTTPILKASIETGGYNHSSWALNKDNLLIFAQEVPTGLPLGIMDYSGYLNNDLEVVKSFKKPLLGPDHQNNTPHNPFMVGDYAVVSYYEDGVVIFDMTNPLQPDTIAYYDTYPENETYTGYHGCWGVYPYLPSGNIIASDVSSGLFILKPSFDLPTTCENGRLDWNETSIDCGGICQPCTPCLQEICGNNLDDDRDGKIDCLDEACTCEGSETQINIKICLEGFYEEVSGQMTSNLKGREVMPVFQPFKIAPFYYAGRESVTSFQDNVVDWVLVEARNPDNLEEILAKKAGLLLTDGRIVQADGLQAIQFGTIAAASIHLVVRHKSHLATMSSSLIDLTNSPVTYDFTLGAEQAMGIDQLKLKGDKYCQIAGDFDQNGIINNLDFNIWKQNSALVNRYLPWDADGNGVINSLDFNVWKLNRSKIGEPTIKLE